MGLKGTPAFSHSRKVDYRGYQKLLDETMKTQTRLHWVSPIKWKRVAHQLDWVHRKKYVSIWLPNLWSALTEHHLCPRHRCMIATALSPWRHEVIKGPFGTLLAWHLYFQTPAFQDGRVKEERHWALSKRASNALTNQWDGFLMLEKCRPCVLTANLLNHTNLFPAKRF